MRKALVVSLFAVSSIALWSADYKPVASTQQLMAMMVKPSMDGLSGMMKAGGPADEKEWQKAAATAAMLAESGELLNLGSRPKDQEVWVKASNDLVAAAQESMEAAHSQNADAWKASLGKMGAACKSCHSVHRKRH